MNRGWTTTDDIENVIGCGLLSGSEVKLTSDKIWDRDRCHRSRLEKEQGRLEDTNDDACRSHMLALEP